MYRRQGTSPNEVINKEANSSCYFHVSDRIRSAERRTAGCLTKGNVSLLPSLSAWRGEGTEQSGRWESFPEPVAFAAGSSLLPRKGPTSGQHLEEAFFQPQELSTQTCTLTKPIDGQRNDPVVNPVQSLARQDLRPGQLH